MHHGIGFPTLDVCDNEVVHFVHFGTPMMLKKYCLRRQLPRFETEKLLFIVKLE